MACSRPLLSNQSAFHYLLGIRKKKSRQLPCQLMSPIFLELRKRRERGEEGGSGGAIKSGRLIGAIFSRPGFYNSYFVPWLN